MKPKKFHQVLERWKPKNRILGRIKSFYRSKNIFNYILKVGGKKLGSKKSRYSNSHKNKKPQIKSETNT
jgi:hypothetical protein